MSTNCEIFWSGYPTQRENGAELLPAEIQDFEIWYRVGGAPNYTRLAILPFNGTNPVKSYPLDELEDGTHEVEGVLKLKDGTESTVTASITLPLPVDPPPPAKSPPKQMIGFGIRPVS